MSHLIEKARSGRSKCRACKQTILKDEVRLGVALPQEHAGFSMIWFHLDCGADARFLELEEAMLKSTVPVPDAASLTKKIAAKKGAQPAMTHPYAKRLEDPYVCEACSSWSYPNSLAVLTPKQITLAGKTLIREAPIHPICANKHFNSPKLLDTVKANSGPLTDEELSWLASDMT